MLIARALIMFVLAFAIIYSVLQMLSIPTRRRQAFNKQNVKQSAIFFTACILAVLVVAFFQVADNLF